MSIYNVEWEITKADGTKQGAIRQVECEDAGAAYRIVEKDLERIHFDGQVTRWHITSINTL